MVDTTQLPAILSLADDHSEGVRHAVFAALVEFGEALPELLAALPEPLSAAERETLLAQVAVYGDEGRIPEAPGAAVAVAEVEPDDDDLEEEDDDEVAFEVGQLVRHRRYGYRGLIVAVDETCAAPEGWYRGNRTQPSREQPWYHVLVNGGDQITYAAHSNLLADVSDDAIEHPLIERFFDGRDGDRYTRNDQPWPGWGQNA